jgi:serine/threonine protein kinase
MMHRDLKSPNVLLSEEGVAKIADVGMVRSAATNGGLVTAQPIMTPLWAAPEVRRVCSRGEGVEEWAERSGS